MTAEVPVCETVVTRRDGTQEVCGQQHLTRRGHPSCPGHLRNGDGRRYPDGTRGPTRERGDPCTLERGFATGHLGIGCCRVHGGTAPNHIRAAQMEMARMECDRLGIPIEIDPAQALLRLVWTAQGNVAFYEALVRELPTHPEDDVLEEGFDGKPHYVRGESGIYGRTYHVSGIPTGEAKRHILLQMYDDERDRLKDYTQAALRAGIEERQMQVSDRSARDVFTALVAGIDAAKLTLEQAEVLRRVVSDHFRGQIPDELGGPTGPAEA